ncbi:MAG TPA: hypothetical protein ENF57_02720 [Candidatus Korarchaeota archaeon]|nr:hypothetical protein [Candidatus Korarchaeota archaeon]
MKSKTVALMGIAFFILSFALGFRAMYYKNPHVMLDETLNLYPRVPVVLNLTSPVSPKVYYNISCSSSGPISLNMTFLDEKGASMRNLEFRGENGSIDTYGLEILGSPPCSMMLNLTRGNAVTCNLKLHYSSVDTGFLTLLTVLQLLSSLIAVSLVASWFIRSYTSSQEKEGEEEYYQSL